MSGTSKLSESTWQKILKKHEKGATFEDLSYQYGIDARNISRGIRRRLAPAPVYEGTDEVAKFAVNEKAVQVAELLALQENVDAIRVTKAKDGTRAVFISDQQIPYHDPALTGSPHKKEALVEHFIRAYEPHYIVIAGDALDFYGLSTFDHNPNRIFRTKDEIKMGGNMIDGLQKCAPNAQIIWLDGNHEYRLWRSYMELTARDPKVLEVLGALDIFSLDTRSLLHLDDRGVLYQPYSGHLNFLSFIVTHGDIVRSNSSYTARAMYDKWHSSGASGHTHRLGCYHFTDGTGRTHAWYELGALCQKTLEYVQNPNWQNGFGYGEVLRNKIHFQLAPIFDNALVVPGIGHFEGAK